MSATTFAAVSNEARGKWPLSADGLPELSVTMAQLVQVLKGAVAIVQSAPENKVPNDLIKDLFQAAVRGSAGKPAFVKVAKKVEQKTRFALLPVV